MMSVVDREPQVLKILTYLKSIVKILVVLGVCILVCHFWQLLINNVLLITL
jgi:hypothetical protein